MSSPPSEATTNRVDAQRMYDEITSLNEYGSLPLAGTNLASVKDGYTRIV